MIKITATSDTAAVMAQLTRRAVDRTAVATANALTLVARIAAGEEAKEMRDVFDRPTPWTLGGVRALAATKTRLVATVKLKDEAGKGTAAATYLLPQIIGGTRPLKKFENALRSIGVLPDGMFAVPAKGAKLDTYGNMSRGQIVQILAYFQAFSAAGYTANTTAAKRAKLAKGTKRKQGFAYFAITSKTGHLHPGIYQRTGFALGSAIKAVLIFVDGVAYQPRFDFKYVVDLAMKRHFAPTFQAQMRGEFGRP